MFLVVRLSAIAAIPFTSSQRHAVAYAIEFSTTRRRPSSELYGSGTSRFLYGLVAPPLISRDLRITSSVYLSRPLSRPETAWYVTVTPPYIVVRGPPAVIFFFQASWPYGWLGINYWIGFDLCLRVWRVRLALIALRSRRSSLAVVASGAMLGLFFVPGRWRRSSTLSFFRVGSLISLWATVTFVGRFFFWS